MFEKAVRSSAAPASSTTEWVKRDPQRVHGGQEGGRTSVAVNGHKLMRLERPIALRYGDVATVTSAGSGGNGPPKERDLTAIEADVRMGYVTTFQAAKAYGWHNDAAGIGF